MNATGTTVLHSARLVSGGEITEDAWLLLDGDVVSARGTGADWQRHAPAEVIDASGRVLTPGFIDLHCHGGGGAAVDDGAAAIARVLDTHTAHGTTRSVLSLVSARIDTLASRLAAIVEAKARDPRVLGAHLEGPFLHPDFRGAHDPDVLRDPDPETVRRLRDAAGNALVQITVAPDRPHALEAIETFADAGVVVAVGHTGADRALAEAAFARGARLLTHAFNAMRGIHHRAPGPVLAAVNASGIVLEVILDGSHVDPLVVRMLFDLAPGRIALVTDAMAAAGAADGDYILGDLEVTVSEGIARLAGTETIAGSTLTQDAALRRAVEQVGLDLPTAVAALTETPARVVGRQDRLGRLDPGFAADVVLLSPALEVESVWSAGRRFR
ncbi:N-acetylglucosamine-6-phosphate deacetylase [Microbacterium sp. CCNWLW134]|uniref:N-acetylglucosamine-6-phosphate deacetylase n=1 Tax=Microbacterium sp. CCNWLW134 TaxID=3122064 RepID=UPI00300FF720